MVEWCERRNCKFYFEVFDMSEVKAEHQRQVELLQPLPIPTWKCEHITIGFMVGLPRPKTTTMLLGLLWTA